jgi:hypothetical protein
MVLIYYQTEDGKITEIFDPVDEGSEEEEKLGEYLGGQCDDRTNMGCFKGFSQIRNDFVYRICKKFVTWYEKLMHIETEEAMARADAEIRRIEE